MKVNQKLRAGVCLSLAAVTAAVVLMKLAPEAFAQGDPSSPQMPAAYPPVIDMHVHGTTVTPKDVKSLEAENVRYLFLAGLAADLRDWAGVDPARYLPSLVFPCDKGRAPITGRQCFEGTGDFPDLEWLRQELSAGRIRGFGEMGLQFLGMGPDDPRLEPFWQLAEEFDVPVALHLGPGPPGAAYDSNPVPFKSPHFRMAAGDPMQLEEVLLRHKRLRIFIMHAGWPRLESMIALMYAHPNVYVDTAALQAPFVVPRAGYYRYLRGLVEAGFGRRVMFGSDFPNHRRAGVEAILEAEFLTDEQKADILCSNAARFLRLDAEVCRP
ncbi:MAG: amidohydrolase family protein [Acidobacteria bacterium]|nr:amidohydrolase family protein [Acidobacteriota bacterium]